MTTLIAPEIILVTNTLNKKVMSNEVNVRGDSCSPDYYPCSPDCSPYNGCDPDWCDPQACSPHWDCDPIVSG